MNSTLAKRERGSSGSEQQDVERRYGAGVKMARIPDTEPVASRANAARTMNGGGSLSPIRLSAGSARTRMRKPLLPVGPESDSI